MTLLLACGRDGIGSLGVTPCGMRSTWVGRYGLRIEADWRGAVGPVNRHHDVPRCSMIDIVVLGCLSVVKDVAEEGPLTGRQSCREGIQPLAKDHGLVFGKLVCVHCIGSYRLP